MPERERRFGIGADRYRPKVTTMTKNGAAKEGRMDGSTTREIRRGREAKTVLYCSIENGRGSSGQSGEATDKHQVSL